MVAFRKRVSERANAAPPLLQEGRELFEEVERLVCGLFDLPDDLTEEVVALAGRLGDLTDEP